MGRIFTRRLVADAVSSSTFRGLLPRLRLKFSVPVRGIRERGIKVLVGGGCVPFSIGGCSRVGSTCPSLYPSFVLCGRTRCVRMVRGVPVKRALLRALLLSPVLSFSGMRILLSTFKRGCVATGVTRGLISSGVAVGGSVFATT